MIKNYHKQSTFPQPKRSKIEFGNNKSKALFGIAQGGLHKDLESKVLKS